MPKHSLYLSKIFKPNLREITLEEESKLQLDAITVATLDIPSKFFTIKEVRAIIKNLNPKKTSFYDFITSEALQMPEI
jgi:hypothetical protein